MTPWRQVAEAIVTSALARKESRGGHFRDDHPEKVAEFAKLNFVVEKGDGDAMRLRPVPLPEMPVELQRIVEENK